jgi:hypothetical protein
MAKVKNPLLSQKAHGTISKVHTHRDTKNGAVVSAYSLSGGLFRRPPSILQLTQRGLYSDAVSAWNVLSIEQKNEYVLRAIPLALTGFNLYIKENLGSSPVPPDPEPWYDENWSHRLKITIHSSFVSSDLIDFRVFLRLSDFPSVFWDNVKNGGGDIRITKSDGTTEVPREIVSCDTTTQKGEVHFKASGVLSSSVDTDFYIYFGNSSSSDYAPTDTYGAQAVWTDYAFVSHDGGGTNSKDGTIGTPFGDIVIGGGGDSPTGKATQFNGTSEYIDYADSSALRPTNLTLQAWLKNDGGDWNYPHEEPISKRTGSLYNGYMFFARNDLDFRVYASDNLNWQFAQSEPLDRNIWNFYSGVRGDDYLDLYINGVWVAEDTDLGTNGITYNGTQYPLRIGKRNSDALYDWFDGFLGEIRISPIARSAAWLATEYANQNSPSTFYAI